MTARSDKKIPLEWRPDALTVANCLGSPRKNVERNLPLIYDALDEFDIHYYRGIIAVLATVGVECRTFHPIDEYGGPKYWFRMYDIESPDPKRQAKARELGNLLPGEGILYHGRGFVQLTGKFNYQEMGKALGIDLESDPDEALDPAVAARCLARFCRTHGVDVAAQREDWKGVRRKVNGGLTHYDRLMSAVGALKAAYNARG